jgi:TonB-linked SusC/RagA family outer membrane protein
MRKKLFLFLVCLIVGIGLATAQTTRITGVVVSAEDGQPIVGASIMVKGTSLGTVTDVNGAFYLNVPGSAKTFAVSYIGMDTQEVVIKAGVIKIVLKPTLKQLDEVVVVAYGTAKRESLTGSVAVVDSKKLEKHITTSVTGALEGSTPGVQVNNTYGEPGSDPVIRIRGFSSVNGSNDPLYVVDGVPYDGNISDISSTDVESISILKDAASAALYGNRASNGVILITTKKGKTTGTTTLTFSTNQGMYTRGIPEYDRLGANQWMETEWLGMKNYAMSLSSLKLNATDAAAFATNNLIGDLVKRNIYNAADNALFDANGKLTATQLPGYDDLDWSKGVVRTGRRQEYNATATSGGDKFNVYSSIGYLKEDGYINNIGFERYSGRINTNYNPNPWLKVGININATTQTSNYNGDASGTAYANPFHVCRYMAPVYPMHLHNADGSYKLDASGNKQYDLTSSYLDNRNIVYEIQNNFERQKRNTLEGQAYGTITLPYDFNVTIKGDLNKSTNNRSKYDNPRIGDGATNNGRLTDYSYQYSTYNFQQQLSWSHEFGLHHIDVLVGHENYGYKRSYFYGMNTGMSVQGNYVMGNFTTNSFLSGADDEYKTESYLSRARYNYDEKYFADISFRRDGSSRFNPNSRWGNFYSMGGNWNISKEDFMKSIAWVNNLKLRASYGEVGNDSGVGLYGYMALYELDKNGGSGSLIKQTLSANNIKWETNQTVDAALEGRLFDRLNFSVGYFDKRSKDLLFAVNLPLSAGSYPHDSNDPANMNLTINRNIGTISNRGWEISADYDLIKSRDLTWNIGADATFLKNKVIKLPGGQDILHDSYEKFSEGHSIYEFFTWHFVGVDQMTGNSLYTIDPTKKDLATSANKLVTINGTDYTTDNTYGLKKWAGSASPKVYGAFHSNLSWKNFSMGFLFTYALGGKVYNSSYASLMSTSAASASALHKDVLKSWNGVPTGMTATSADRIWADGTPLVDHNLSIYTNGVSDRWLTNASYLVLKNINFSYQLPKSIISSLGIQGLLITAGIENAFTLTARKGLNPQYSYNGLEDDTYVTARVYNLGLTVNF